MGSYRKCCSLLAVAGSLFFALPDASANLLCGSPEMDDQPGREMLAGTIGSGSSFAFDGALPAEFTLGGTRGVSSARVANQPPSINLRRYQSATVTGAPGETVTLDLTNFAMSGHSTLTLQGTATTTLIINVARQFSLSGNAKIVLSGGIDWDNVFFNVLGNGRTVSVRGNARLEGVLTASDRTVRMRGHAIVYGRVIAERILITGAAQILTPPVSSP